MIPPFPVVFASPSFLPESLALFARFTTPPSQARKVLINNRISALISSGVWSKLDCDWVMAAADAQSARLNWKQSQYDLTPVSSPAFGADRGYTSDGISSYLSSGFVPLTAPAAQFSLNSASMGFYSRTNNSGAVVDIGSRITSTVAQTFIQARLATNQSVYRVNQTANGTSVANADSSGAFVARRSDAATAAIFRNGSVIGSDPAIASGALSSAEIVVCALNTGGAVSAFTTRQYAIAHIGASLSDAEILSKYNADLAYLQAVGAA
jgi:hypothetical protein